MRIDGKTIAQTLFTDLTTRVAVLKKKNITPTLVVILVGDNPESLSYIRQKQKATERIGGRFIFEQLPKTTLPKELSARVAMYNRDPDVHALIVQRPLPPHIDLSINQSVDPKKDIDGFVKNSPFDVPVAMAVFTIVKHVFALSSPRKRGSAFIGEYQNRFPVKPGMTVVDWLRRQRIIIVGRGETAGKPIAAAFEKQQCATSVITSKTASPEEIIKNADIIISCVGKRRIITADAIKSGVILISVGITSAEDGKLHGDYEEEDVKNIASFYTPTPGGVGPLNIASLMQNLVLAAQK